MESPLNTYLDVAVLAVRQAGDILMEHLGKLRDSDVNRKGESDWVTTVDRASEEVVIKILKKAFPDHAIQAEESAPQGVSSDAPQWLIDPLDGTINYIHRFPMFGISVALAQKGVLQVGVVYDPQRQELFTACRGQGARLNDVPIQVSGHASLKEALLATGFPFRAKEHLDLYMESFRQIFLHTGSIRRAGSAALDLAYTACGRVDGFWEMYLAPWDMAAGALLIEEAGGVVSDFFGAGTYLSSGHITAGNPSLHSQLVKVLTPIFRGAI